MPDTTISLDIGGEVVWISCGNFECDGLGPTNLDEKEAVIHWNRIARIQGRHTRAAALLRRVLDGPRPAHGPLDLYDEIAAFLRETDNG